MMLDCVWRFLYEVAVVSKIVSLTLFQSSMAVVKWNAAFVRSTSRSP